MSTITCTTPSNALPDMPPFSAGLPHDVSAAPPTDDEPSDAVWLALTTVANREDAIRLAQAMVTQRLAACVQISPIESLYHWQGVMQQESEWRVLFKTTARVWPALQAALLAQHPYSLPALLAWSCAQALPAFAQWVADETRPAPVPERSRNAATGAGSSSGPCDGGVRHKP